MLKPGVAARAADVRRPATGHTTPIVNPEPERTENRFNDGKTDRQGRFWAGGMHDPETEPTGSLYRLDGDLSCRRLVEGLVCSNALGWSPDGRTMYHADPSPSLGPLGG